MDEEAPGGDMLGAPCKPARNDYGIGFLAKVDHDEGESTSPEPVPRDPLKLLTREAVRVGLIREGDKPDQMLVDFWMSAIEASAAIADHFPDPEHDERTVGDVIRAHLHE